MQHVLRNKITRKSKIYFYKEKNRGKNTKKLNKIKCEKITRKLQNKKLKNKCAGRWDSII